MHLFLAGIWLALAVIVFVYESSSGPLRMRIWLGDVNLSIGWIMLVLGLYNVARWFSMRVYRKDQRAMFRAASRYRHREREEHAGPPPAPDPNFRFTEDPHPPPGP